MDLPNSLTLLTTPNSGNLLIPLKPMESAPKDKLIIALVQHTFDPNPDRTARLHQEGKLTPYEAQASGGYVSDGVHLLHWGGEYIESDWETGRSFKQKPWWFAVAPDGDFDAAANPVGWYMAFDVPKTLADEQLR